MAGNPRKLSFKVLDGVGQEPVPVAGIHTDRDEAQRFGVGETADPVLVLYRFGAGADEDMGSISCGVYPSNIA